MNKISRYLAIGLSILLALFLMYTFRTIVGYVLMAWIVSMIGEPIVQFMQRNVRVGRFRMGRTTAALVTLFMLFLILIFLILMFIPLIIEQANNIANVDYAKIGESFEQPYEQMRSWFEQQGVKWPEVTPEQIAQEVMAGRFDPQMVGDFLTSLISATSTIFITIFAVAFISFFFLQEKGLFLRLISLWMPQKYEGQVNEAIGKISHLLTRYFGGILLQITILTLFVSILLYFLGIKNALLIGFFAGIINVIPYLGPLIGGAFGVFITISSHLDASFYNELLPLLLQVMAVFAAMQMLDNFVLQPLIYSNSVMAHPLEIFIIILVGAQIGGIVGMVLAIPTYTVGRVIASVFLSQFEMVQRFTQGINRVEKKDTKD